MGGDGNEGKGNGEEGQGIGEKNVFIFLDLKWRKMKVYMHYIWI